MQYKYIILLSKVSGDGWVHNIGDMADWLHCVYIPRIEKLITRMMID
jgi:hypothetical protein